LTQMQLQKLVYITHGWSLAISNSPITSDAPCAWEYGPVYPELWEALRRYGRSSVSGVIKFGDFGMNMFAKNADEVVTADFSETETSLIAKIFEIYGSFHAFQLSALTHKEGTPWYKVFVENKKKKGEIHNIDIRNHFVEIALNAEA